MTREELQKMLDKSFNDGINKSPFVYQLLVDSIDDVISGRVNVDNWKQALVNICNAEVTVEDLKKLFKVL